MKIKSHIISLAAIASLYAPAASAEAPSGYYDKCEGKSGSALLSALCSTISNHTNVGYDGLWEVYETSDIRDDGTVWDMYSTKHWTVGKEHCGNYSNVGDCLNREHSFPKSWFNDAAPMVSDGYHIYPTDGKVNGQRSNFPFGECANGTTLPSHGNVKALGKLGASTFPGYSGKVFEPDDEYKGDFARTYFYMAACYNGRIANWSSDMLAGNSYPAFKQWAIDLLLKWHRNDPVSSKETVRNDAVSAHQKNRNPFIDHPELAEHIWGDKKNVAWSASGQADPVIVTPVNGSTIDLGVTAVNHTCSKTITVTSGALTSNISVKITGQGFAVSASSLNYAATNGSGAQLTISFSSPNAGDATGTLTLSSGSATSTVTIRAKAMDGIPVPAPTNISDRSFVAGWVNISGPTAKYQFSLWRDGVAQMGFPMTVNASDCELLVENLEPLTTYTYQLAETSTGVKSDVVSVTTGAPIPSIQFLFDGELNFTSQPGVPSQAAEVLLDIDNVESDIVVSTAAPFQLSTDKANWSTSITLDPEQDRFYLRVLSETAGNFSATLRATADDYSNDVIVNAFIGEYTSLIEDFEASSAGFGNYSGGVYKGSACTWLLTNAGIYAGNSEPYHSEIQSVRFGKASSPAGVEMLEDRPHGIGTVTFWTRKWNNDNPSTLAVEVSTDGGSSWSQVGEVSVSEQQWVEAEVKVGISQPARIRITRAAAGGRLNLDDVSTTDYAGVDAAIDSNDYHSWDAFCRDGFLVIETARTAQFAVFSIDGIVRFDGSIDQTLSLPLAPGLYIVASDNFTRRVLVK